ncbi:MAG: Lrp/AsnC family transcriptional regulator [Candidatus Lokiarchaeota archaeon]|nr:Lrp/AsnC family transcriptional regulator [Candidatus Harpocratesius repetitus]
METPTYHIDEIDEKILSILDQDSRLGYTQIAKILKKSHTTIKKRLDELERLKIIKKYTIDIDFEKIGYEIVAIIEVSIAKGKLLEVQQLIASHPNVFGVYDVTGDYDSIILMRFKSRKELSKIIKKILKSPDVIRTNTHIALTVIKDNVDFDKMIKSQKWQEWSEWKEVDNNKMDPGEILTDIRVESQLFKSKKKKN